MHIKRFVARDMKHAIRLVRDEQGPDAVILSNQRVPGGIEVISAVDYDPNLINDALIANALAADGEPTPAGGARAPHEEPREEPREDRGRRLTLPAPPSRQRAARGLESAVEPQDDTAALIDALRARARQPRPDAAESRHRAATPSGATPRHDATAAGAQQGGGSLPAHRAADAPATGGHRSSAQRRDADAATREDDPARTARTAPPAPDRRDPPRRRGLSLAQMNDDAIVVPAAGAAGEGAAPAQRARMSTHDEEAGDRRGQEVTTHRPSRYFSSAENDARQAAEERDAVREASSWHGEDTFWSGAPTPFRDDADEGSPVPAHEARNDAFDAAPMREQYEARTAPAGGRDAAPTRAGSRGDGQVAPRERDARAAHAGTDLPATPQRATAIPRPPGNDWRYSDILDEAPVEEDDDAPLSAEAGEDVVELSSAADEGEGGRGGFFGVLAGVTGLGQRRGTGRSQRSAGAASAREGGSALPSATATRGRSGLIIRSLTRVGVAEPVARELTTAVDVSHGAQPDWGDVLAQASARLHTLDHEVIDTGGVIALVGPTGVGKTTSVAKLAARYALKHGRDSLALLTTDTFRVGAHEQLNTFAGILGVPLHSADDASDLGAKLKELSKNRLVLIDTAGMSQRDMHLAEELALLSRSRARIRVLLTLSANTERRTMLDAIERFGTVDPIGCILTKVDEALSPGTAMSALIETGLPLAYTSDGQNVPEDLYWAGSKRKGLVQHVFEQADLEAREDHDDAGEDEVRESA